MKRPIIGITASNSPSPDWGEGRLKLARDGQLRLYSEAVALGGGLPLILPLIHTPLNVEAEAELAGGCGAGNIYGNAEMYMKHLDGLLLPGGGDVAPPAGAADAENFRLVDRSRDVWESALLAAALELGKPVLGICRGMQLMNRALGGSLWADLPSERPGSVEHQQKLLRARGTHRVVIEAASRLAAIIGFSEITVNSGHHQGVKDPAPPLVITARADDGLAEALEHRTATFALGVQWHPEGQFAAEHSRALFRAFIKAAGC